MKKVYLLLAFAAMMLCSCGGDAKRLAGTSWKGVQTGSGGDIQVETVVELDFPSAKEYEMHIEVFNDGVPVKNTRGKGKYEYKELKGSIEEPGGKVGFEISGDELTLKMDKPVILYKEEDDTPESAE